MPSRYAGVAALAFLSILSTLAGGCATKTLDAGHDNPPDACAPLEGGAGCTPTGLLDDLVGYWRLDDGAGTATAFDSSGRGNEGALHGLDTSTAWVAGRSQGALRRRTPAGCRSRASPSIDAIIDRITVSAWVDQEGHDHRRGQLRDGAVAPGRDQRRSALSPVAAARTADPVPHHRRGFVTPAAPDTVPRDTWVHLAGVYDGATARLYVNGVEVASEPHDRHLRPRHDARHPGRQRQRREQRPDRAVPRPHRRADAVMRARSAPRRSAELAAGALFPAGARDAGADCADAVRRQKPLRQQLLLLWRWLSPRLPTALRRPRWWWWVVLGIHCFRSAWSTSPSRGWGAARSFRCRRFHLKYKIQALQARRVAPSALRRSSTMRR